MKRGIGRGFASALALFVLLIAGVLAVASLLSSSPGGGECDGDAFQGSPATARAGLEDLSTVQLANARIVIVEGRRLNRPDQAIVIALAVASQESRFLNYANDGRGHDLLFSQAGIQRSMRLPHEAVGTDHGSLGIFQQQWPWWGSMTDLMDPARAADKFYLSLSQIPGWETMPVTVAAQRVQRSAYPRAYADDEVLARRLLGTAMPESENAAMTTDFTTRCTDVTAPGTVSFPLPNTARYIDQRNWGHSAGVWSHGHTGTDLSAPCGTPVLAATSGTIVIRTDQPWAGRWLVQVSTGERRLTTWYGHMRTLNVAQGQTVAAGEEIGEVGDLGNATGCHLHFEVHPRGGSIYEDNVDPSVWLASHVGRGSDGGAPAPTESSFTLATFNTLGASHTRAAGKHPEMPSGAARTRGLVELLDRHSIEIAGFQEFQQPQYRTFVQLAGSRYAAYHPPSDTENSVVWLRDRWSLVRAQTLAIPYFDGRERHMPVVTLRSLSSARQVTVVNVHNPADTRRFPGQAAWRTTAVTREIEAVRQLTAEKTGPIVVTGDLNDRRDAYCRFVRSGVVTAPTSPVSGATCEPPASSGIDWIFASDGIDLSTSNFWRTGVVGQISDHPLVTASVTLE